MNIKRKEMKCDSVRKIFAVDPEPGIDPFQTLGDAT